MKHLIFKTSDTINILNKKNKITVNPEILASITTNKLNEKTISILADNIIIKNEVYTHKINKPEIYLRENSKNNLQFAIKIKDLNYQPAFVNNNIIKSIQTKGKLLKYKNIYINNYIDWFSNEGGLDIENFEFFINKNLFNGNAFFGIDDNLDIQSTISFKSNNLSALFLILKENNYITKNSLENSNFIIQAIEIASDASGTQPNYSISLQNGYLSLMGIKLLKIPNLSLFQVN